MSIKRQLLRLSRGVAPGCSEAYGHDGGNQAQPGAFRIGGEGLEMLSSTESTTTANSNCDETILISAQIVHEDEEAEGDEEEAEVQRRVRERYGEEYDEIEFQRRVRERFGEAIHAVQVDEAVNAVQIRQVQDESKQRRRYCCYALVFAMINNAVLVAWFYFD